VALALRGFDRQISNRRALVGAFAAMAVILLARLVGLGDVTQFGTFGLIFTSIVVEALPFVLLGALVSAIIEVYVSDDVFIRLARLPLGLQVPGAALGGFAFPVCECGSVPVARRLIKKGLHPAAGLSFMLASPILNPVVLWSTYVAYKGRGLAWELVAGRALVGLVLAVVLGWIIGADRASTILRAGRDDHVHKESRRFAAFIDHLANDFSFMARFVIIGAALAALLQTAVPQAFIGDIAANAVVACIALMGLAFLLSLCSEADAFVAVSFTQFPISAQLSFLVFGPVIDTKLSFLYGATFRNGFVLRVLIVSVPVVLAGSLWFQAILGSQ
jgi:uncharacterized protein